MGIEPTRSAWKADVLPLNYARVPWAAASVGRTVGSLGQLPWTAPLDSFLGQLPWPALPWAVSGSRRCFAVRVQHPAPEPSHARGPRRRRLDRGGFAAERSRENVEAAYRRLPAVAIPARACCRKRGEAAKGWWAEQDSNLRRQCHQIYSLTPLAARESALGSRTPAVRTRGVHAARRDARRSGDRYPRRILPAGRAVGTAAARESIPLPLASRNLRVDRERAGRSRPRREGERPSP
jgi:hypothetical protein